jgi:hypothetical protein
MWRAFISAWWERFRAEPVQVKDLFALATEADLLGPVLGDKGERSQRTNLGRALMRMRDRVIGEHRVEVLQPDHQGVQHHRLIPVGPGRPDADPQTSSKSAPKSAGKSAPENACGTSPSAVPADFADFSATTPESGGVEAEHAPDRANLRANPSEDVVGAVPPRTGDMGEKSAKSAPIAQSVLAQGVQPADLGADFPSEVGGKSAPASAEDHGDDLNEVTI